MLSLSHFEVLRAYFLTDYDGYEYEEKVTIVFEIFSHFSGLENCRVAKSINMGIQSKFKVPKIEINSK